MCGCAVFGRNGQKSRWRGDSVNNKIGRKQHTCAAAWLLAGTGKSLVGAAIPLPKKYYREKEERGCGCVAPGRGGQKSRRRGEPGTKIITLGNTTELEPGCW